MTLHVASKVMKLVDKDPKVLSYQAEIAFICNENQRNKSKWLK